MLFLHNSTHLFSACLYKHMYRLQSNSFVSHVSTPQLCTAWYSFSISVHLSFCLSVTCLYCVKRLNWSSIFLPCDAMLVRYMLSSCLSVRPSVTSQHCTKMAKHRITNSTVCSFLTPKISAKFQRGHLQRGAKQKWGRFKRRFSTNILLYLRNGAR